MLVLPQDRRQSAPMSIKSVKLYHYPLSRSARVKFLLHEIYGDNFEYVFMDMLKGAGRTPEFLMKNPNHAVPVLDITYEDGTTQTMIESGAMIVFLADAYPEKGLAPSPDDLEARADYLQMIMFGSAHMDTALWEIRMNETLLPLEARSKSVADHYRHKLETEIAPQLESRLKSNKYICGDEFTAADCIMAQNINWAGAYGYCRSNAFKAYMLRLAKRPTFQQAYADRDQFGG